MNKMFYNLARNEHCYLRKDSLVASSLFSIMKYKKTKNERTVYTRTEIPNGFFFVLDFGKW